MNNDGVTSNEKEIFALIDKIKNEIPNDAMLTALTVGGMALRDATKERLLKKMPKAATAHGREKSISMYEGVRVAKSKASSFVAATVYILGNYLNRWFELGTNMRKLKSSHEYSEKRKFKKGENRGAIKPLHFFREARSLDMEKVRDKIFEVIENKIGKIFNRN